MSQGKNRLFVKAEQGVPPAGYDKPSVRYYDKKGDLLVRYEDTVTWRCNNPGSIKYVKRGFAMRNGAICFAMCFAVFPNEFSGRVALITRLKTGDFPGYTLDKFAEVWEPRNIVNYKRMLRSNSGLSLERKIKELSREEFERFRIAIEKNEGWIPGWEEFYPVTP